MMQSRSSQNDWGMTLTKSAHTDVDFSRSPAHETLTEVMLSCMVMIRNMIDQQLQVGFLQNKQSIWQISLKPAQQQVGQ